ncbi:isopentenyl-diphosphate Delta-isomerase [Dactylosporangium matsuzakiense]|uniref:isopentenyl-diphosphate Delta-isomerase n=1 Tax=Dactylosporangium matsuzakiense TaxID=53360 RepID=A0A9W6KN92_9ACTN|nr:isopentenyl-diphosphate Delta-isomerase [Dactylosporangium matsuzakiense]GLL03664.1 isopentenyl-diphosphate Delta-isomerase [Dactylosporangium matsuzakiense]
MSRESQLVELVTPDGAADGSATVDAAHRAPGRLHRAFSVLLVAPDGRILLQQRAAAKTRFALRWANACCGHPGPGEPVATAAARRLSEELGVSAPPLREVGVYLYQADDPDSGRVEFEFDHVLVGPYDGDVRADPAEVAEVEWVYPDELADRLKRFPDFYAPWLAGVLDAWRSAAA